MFGHTVYCFDVDEVMFSANSYMLQALLHRSQQLQFSPVSLCASHDSNHSTTLIRTLCFQ
jgi:hypothetical protein